MTSESHRLGQMNNPKSRLLFLLLLALGISVVFLWVTRDFIMPIFIAAVLAGLARPLYRRTVAVVGGRRNLAAGLVIVMSLLLVIIPLLVFLGIIVAQAVEISGLAGEWATYQMQHSEELRKRFFEIPFLEEFIPYQDEIYAKASQLVSKLGSFVAQGLAASALGTAEAFLMIFVAFYAMFCFLNDGAAVLNWTFDRMPLSASDKKRLLSTFSSVSRATIKGTVIVGIVQGGLAGAAFAIAGIKGAFFWAAVMAVMSMIPTFGSALIWVPAVIFLAVTDKTGAAIGLAAWCSVVVGTVDNFLRPLLIGKDTQMPDLLVLVTSLGGLAGFGFFGLVIGPMVGALFLAIWDLWDEAVVDADQ